MMLWYVLLKEMFSKIKTSDVGVSHSVRVSCCPILNNLQDAVPVHFANGIWGVLSVGFFAEPGLMEIAGYNADNPGWFYSWGKGSDLNLMLCQIVALIWVLGWVTVTMTPFFVILLKLGMFRVDPLEEEVGLDISHHRGAAYDLSGPKQQDVEELMEERASRHGKVEVPKEVAQAADVAAEAPEEEEA